MNLASNLSSVAASENITPQQPAPPRHESNPRITEIHLTHAANNGYEFMFPMLAHLSQTTKGRWFTWIVTSELERRWFSPYPFNISGMRLIHVKSEEDAKKCYLEALRNGTSATVVVNFTLYGEDFRMACENAAQQGNSRGVLFAASN